MATKPHNIKGIETGTGRPWEEWVEWLDSIGAAEMPHPEIARRVHEHGANEWWAQGVTVAYEQHIGRRLPGQRCTGDFAVTVTRTLPGEMNSVLAAWCDFVAGMDGFNGAAFSREPSTSETEKWRYWRCALEDGTTVTVNIQTKPNGQKSSVAINHEKIGSAEDVEEWRAYWKGFAAELAAQMAG